MIWSNLTLIVRSLRKFKLYAFTTIFGFGTALAIATLATAFLIHELHTDRQVSDNVFRVLMVDPVAKEERPITYYEMPQILRTEYPEVDRVSHVVYRGYQLVKIDRINEQEEFLEKGAMFCDEFFLDMLSLELSVGNAKEALSNPNSTVLSQDFARKYFGKVDVLNETILIYDKPYQITGILKPTGYNSHLKLNMLISYSTLPKATRPLQLGGFTYVELKDPTDKEAFQNKLNQNRTSLLSYASENWPEEPFQIQQVKEAYFYQAHQPHLLEVVRFRSEQVLKMYGGVAVAIFIVAFINFVIYFFAKSVASGKQFFIKKIYGVSQSSIAITYFIETFIVLISAFILALLSSIFLIPAFNQWAYSNVPQYFAFNLEIVVYIMLLILGSSVATGVIFHFLFSKKQTKATPNSTAIFGKIGFLKALLLVQLCFAAGLMTFFLLIKDQINGISNYPLGFNDRNLLEIDLSRLPAKYSPQYLKSELLKSSNVESASICFGGPLTGRWSRNITVDGIDADCGFYQVDENFIPTMEIKMINGTNFVNYTSNDSSYLVINETAARLFNVKDIDSMRNDLPIPGKIVGIFKDFHYASLENKIGPVFFMYTPYDTLTEEGAKLLLRLHNAGARELASIETQWKELTSLKFDYSLIENSYREFYTDKINQSSLLSISVISILVVCCFGVVGFTSFATQRRMKEIAIRKVHGASERNIYVMWGKSLGFSLVLSIIISLPFAFYFFNKWTASIIYKTPISIGVVPLVIVLIGITLFGAAFYNVFVSSTQNAAKALKQD